MSNIKIILGATIAPVSFTTFSDGAENCQLPLVKELSAQRICRVQLDVENCTRDLVRLMLVKDALDSLGCTEVKLTMLYIPHARADRRFSEGSSHPLKVFAKAINSMGFSEVTVADPHSDVATALIDNVNVISQTECFLSVLPQIKRVTNNYILAAPDLGSTKKLFDTVMKLGHTDYIQTVKIRDTFNGNIIKCDVQCDDLGGKDVIIVDDLADQGGSFKFLAQKLLTKNCGKIILYTTHGIYPKGLESLKGYIDYIFCYNLIGGHVSHVDITKFNNI